MRRLKKKTIFKLQTRIRHREFLKKMPALFRTNIKVFFEMRLYSLNSRLVLPLFQFDYNIFSH